MTISNITVKRIIIQEAPAKRDDYEPDFEDTILKLGKGELMLINRRLNDYIGTKGTPVEMRVMNPPSSSFETICSLLDNENTPFVNASKKLATDLINVQIAGTVKDGTAVFMTGECFLNDTSYPFLSIIKADNVDGLLPSKNSKGETELHLLKNIIFTEGARLLKIGFFVLTNSVNDVTRMKPNDFRVFIFDHTVSSSGTKDAARYFYSAFLGCTRLEDNDKRIQAMFKACQSVIKKSTTFTDIEKYEALNQAKYYFSNKNRTSITTRELGLSIFGDAEQEDYKAFKSTCEKKECWGTFENCTTLIKNELGKSELKLRTRNGGNVTLKGTPESINRDVKVEGDPDDSEVTLIRVFGKLIQ